MPKVEYVSHIIVMDCTRASLPEPLALIVCSYSALEAVSLLGGEDLQPFYAMLEGGRDGEFFAELEEYFYYAQIRRYVIYTIE